MSGEPGLIEYAIATGIMLVFFWSWLVEARRSQKRGDECPIAGSLRAEVHKVDERVEQIEHDLERMRVRLRDTASHADVQEIKRMTQENRAAIDKITSSLPDMEARQRAMSDRFVEVSKDVAVTRNSVENVEKQMDQIMRVLVPKGMSK